MKKKCLFVVDDFNSKSSVIVSKTFMTDLQCLKFVRTIIAQYRCIVDFFYYDDEFRFDKDLAFFKANNYTIIVR